MKMSWTKHAIFDYALDSFDTLTQLETVIQYHQPSKGLKVKSEKIDFVNTGAVNTSKSKLKVCFKKTVTHLL